MTDSTSTLDARVRDFFDVFSTATEKLDVDALADRFADPFLSADRTGARPVPVTAFLAALPGRARMFADAGIGAATLASASHTQLDEHYVLVRTEWTAPRTGGGESVRLASSFLLHDDGERLRVVLYLNHEGL